MLNKSVGIEILWFLGISILTIFIIILMVGSESLFKGEVDLQMHDNYFVFSLATVYILLFLILSFIIYLLRQIKSKFENLITNTLLLFITGALIICCSFLIKITSDFGFQFSGWTLYPPLSALPNQTPKPIENNFDQVIGGILFVQLIFVLTLIVLGIRTGKIARRKNDDQQSG